MNQEALKRIIRQEKEVLENRTKKSHSFAARAAASMPGAVPNGVYFQAPYPVLPERGKGSRLWDIDGNEYIDYAAGFGVSVWGHNNPEITSAVQKAAERGMHFGASSEDVIAWSEELRRRYRLHWIRFSCSGSEATGDALRLARALTGRNLVAKVEGGYHGSHPLALVSSTSPDVLPGEPLMPRPWGEGVSPGALEEVRPFEWNNAASVEAALLDEQVAALIMEPILFNVGAIFPEDGFLQEVRRLCDETGTLLVWDETKTGASVAWGGAEELFGVRPDIKTLGKGIGGGMPCGALGATSERGYDLLQSGEVPQIGTFAGTPVQGAAGRAALRVLSQEAFGSMEEHRLLLHRLFQETIDRYELPAYLVGAGAKSCLVWANPDEGRLRNFRDYCARWDRLAGISLWIWLFNRGVWLAQGQDEQTTHSVAHGKAEAEKFAAEFEGWAKTISS